MYDRQSRGTYPSKITWRILVAFEDAEILSVPVPRDITISGLGTDGAICWFSYSAMLTGLLCPLIPPS